MITLLEANGALLAAAVGLLLISVEFCLPGWVIPGVTGGVCLICGAYRLAMLDASAAAAFGVAAALVFAAAAGYGLLPVWSGVVSILVLPWLCRQLLPEAIHWPTAMLVAVVPLAHFYLLRIAARAVANKTLIQ